MCGLSGERSYGDVAHRIAPRVEACALEDGDGAIGELPFDLSRDRLVNSIVLGGAWALGTSGWASGFALVIAVSALLAGVVGVVAAYAGFALRKIVNKFLAVPQHPPHYLQKMT